MMATSGHYREKDTVSCPLCYQEYDEPMLLTCSHIICHKCVKHLQRRGKLKCPDCKALMNVSDIIVEPTLQTALNTLSTVKESAGGLFSNAKDLLCTECPDGLHAWHCLECDAHMCDGCYWVHEQKMEKLGQSHTLQSTKESSKQKMERLLKRAAECESMIEECTKEKENISAKIGDIEREKEATLEFLRKIQQQIVDMINSFFTSIDEAYIDATPEEMDLINDRLGSIRNDPNDPMVSLKEMRKLTDELLKAPDGVSVESFQKIKQMHIEELEKFRAFYGTPFKLPERVGDETRRYSNLHRSKAVLEAITGYDPDGSKAQERGVSEALPTFDEIAQITGMSSQDVQQVLDLYDVQLDGSDPYQQPSGGESKETNQEVNSPEDSKLEGATALCGATALNGANALDSTNAPSQSIAHACQNESDGSDHLGTLETRHKVQQTSNKTSEVGAVLPHSETLCTNVSDSKNNDALFDDTEDVSQEQNKDLGKNLQHLNLGEIQDP